MTRKSLRKPGCHVCGSSYLHRVYDLYFASSLAMDRSSSPSASGESNLRMSTKAFFAGMISSMSSAPMYTGMEPRASAIQIFSVAYPAHAGAFSMAK